MSELLRYKIAQSLKNSFFWLEGFGEQLSVVLWVGAGDLEMDLGMGVGMDTVCHTYNGVLSDGNCA